MNETLESVAACLVADGKGILAADESVATATRRFDTVGIRSTEQSRRAYREMLFTTPGAAEFISGVILYDETIRQKSSDGTPLAEVLPHARAGKLRILATTARERSVLAPDIPTFFELGFEKIVVQDWSGFLAPAGTPADVVARANAAISAALETPKVKEAMANLGMEVGARTPAAFAETVRESWERYRDIVKESGFQAEQ